MLESVLGGNPIDFHQDHQGLAHSHDIAFLSEDLFYDPRAGGRDLGIDLVGGDFDQRLVYFDPIPFLHQPVRDSALDDRLPEFG